MHRTFVAGSDRARETLALGERLARTTGAPLVAADVRLAPAAAEEGDGEFAGVVAKQPARR